MADNGDVRDSIMNTENVVYSPMIQTHLLTGMLSPLDFLGFLRVHLLSVSDAAAAAAGAAAGAAGGNIISIKLISSWGNHATAVCFVKDGGDMRVHGQVTACLRFKRLPEVASVITNRYDSPQGVVQLVFPKLVEKVREIMVLGNVPLEPNSWTNWERTITDSVLGVLNSEGITAGRNELERSLTASFERIRRLEPPEGDLDKNIHLREIRIKYCNLLLDLLRDDLLRNYGGSVQQGLLGTINIYNNNDEYTTHNGKHFTDPALGQAAYNVLFLVHIEINRHIYTVHMDIDRKAVKRFLDSINVTRGENEFQSVSYWVGGVIEFIHNNKAEFVRRVFAALNVFSARTPGVGAVDAEKHKDFVLGTLRHARDDVSLTHDAFILSCKSVTLIRDSGPPATPVPTDDNTVGTDHQGRPFSSFKETDFAGRKITGVSFDVYFDDVLLGIGGNECYCHFPTYDPRPIDRIIGTQVGVFVDSQIVVDYPGPTLDSQEIQRQVISYVDDLFEFRDAAEAERAEAERAEAERAEASGAGPAITLADAFKTAVNASSEEETTAKASLLGLLKNPTFVAKKVVGYICDSYNFWSNPFKVIRRAGSSSLLHDKGLDIQLLDLVACALYQQISREDMSEKITSIIAYIRNSDHFLALTHRESNGRIIFTNPVDAVSTRRGGGRSRRRSLKKKTRRISSIRQRTLKKKNISRKYSRRSRRRRGYSRKNGRR